MKYALIATVALLLAGCSPTQQEYQASLPSELSDCKFYVVVTNGDPDTRIALPEQFDCDCIPVRQDDSPQLVIMVQQAAEQEPSGDAEMIAADTIARAMKC